jgi:hypothetical protein
MNSALGKLEAAIESAGIQILNIGGIHASRYSDGVEPKYAFTDINMNEIKPGDYAVINLQVIVPLAKD